MSFLKVELKPKHDGHGKQRHPRGVLASPTVFGNACPRGGLLWLHHYAEQPIGSNGAVLYA